tara:strand:- start:339 stop:548 length:210 start_codon:yes stop_codon:yes gene_type:complete
MLKGILKNTDDGWKVEFKSKRDKSILKYNSLPIMYENKSDLKEGKEVEFVLFIDKPSRIYKDTLYAKII